jgi:glycosyltransferase involved in cell wall biosynthesis
MVPSGEGSREALVTLALIIPALNEEESLPGVLAQVPKEIVSEIVVVDNGSTDHTAAVARSLGARVVEERRRGYGAACWAGVQATDAEILVFMDADGSFSPEEIPKLAAPIVGGRAVMALGTRMLTRTGARSVPVHARLGNKLVAAMIGLACRVRTTDLGPFRAIRRDALERLKMKERTYGWPSEMIMKAGKLGYRVVEVPVSYRLRTGGKSKVSGTVMGSVKASLAMLKVVIRWFFWRPSGLAILALLLYAPNEGSGKVQVYDLSRLELIAQIPTGPEPHGITVDPKRNLIYVGNEGDSTVSLITGKGWRTIARLPVSRGPGGIAADRRTGRCSGGLSRSQNRKGPLRRLGA